MNKIRRAIISVTDKTGVVELARGLAAFGVEILSTGGTAQALRRNGIEVVEVSDYTGFPEMMDGRIKTLHPRIHGGILAVRDDDLHLKEARSQGIELIDMVVINLYRFEDTVAREGCSLAEAVENIDIGGPTLVRAAAKNYRFVTVVTDPGDYRAILDEMEHTEGMVSPETNFRCAVKAFQLTARYDGAIANYLGRIEPDGTMNLFPQAYTFQVQMAQALRYGENPHQQAAYYREFSPPAGTITTARQLQGKTLSYNNIMDADAAWQMVWDFDQPTAVIMKHANPCGAAVDDHDLLEAYRRAWETDPLSAFGGIVAFNGIVGEKLADELARVFLEVIVAPGYDEKAKTILAAKKNVRLLEVPWAGGHPAAGWDFRRVGGGLLVQERDRMPLPARSGRVVTKREPTAEEWSALDFAWRVVKHVKSNAIVFANRHQLVGVGAGQMSRVDSVKIAAMKAVLPIAGTVMASDAFFPFRDGIDTAVAQGITAVIQPGGSVRDDEVIAAADEHNLAMVFTGERHFKH